MSTPTLHHTDDHPSREEIFGVLAQLAHDDASFRLPYHPVAGLIPRRRQASPETATRRAQALFARR